MTAATAGEHHTAAFLAPVSPTRSLPVLLDNPCCREAAQTRPTHFPSTASFTQTFHTITTWYSSSRPWDSTTRHPSPPSHPLSQRTSKISLTVNLTAALSSRPRSPLPADS